MGHRVIYGGGDQTLAHQPRRDGAPIVVGSATYRIVDLSRTEDESGHEVVAAGTVATVSVVATTTTAAAGLRADDPSVVTVTSAVGVAEGSRFLLRDSATRRAEIVEVENLIGTTLRLTRDVVGDYASGADFLGLEISGTFPGAHANDENAYKTGVVLYAVDWTYDGRTTREFVSVVRGRSQCPVDGSRLVERVPGLSSRMGDSFSPEEFVGAAWLAVRVDLQRFGVDVDDMLADEVLEALVCYRAAADIYALNTSDQADSLYEVYEGRYRDSIAGLTAGQAKPGVVVVGRSGAAHVSEEVRGVVARR